MGHEELRLPHETFAVGTPMAVFQVRIKHSCATHGAGARVVFRLHVLPHSAGGDDGMTGCAGPQPSWV